MSKIRVTVRSLEDRHYQVNLSSRVAVITQTLLKPGKGGRLARCKAAYFGFDSHDQAIDFANEVRVRFPKARMQVRKAKRLTTAFEVKVSHDAAEQLAWEVAKKILTTSQRTEQHLQLVRSRPIMPSVRPDAPVKPRHTGRTLVQVGGRSIGID